MKMVIDTTERELRTWLVVGVLLGLALGAVAWWRDLVWVAALSGWTLGACYIAWRLTLGMKR